MKKQKTAKLDLNGQEATIIDEVVAKLGFRADAQALDRVKQRLEDFDLRLQAAARRMQVVEDGDTESKVRVGANL